ncbi:MAG: type II toxin-antitoxin system VapC family toxin [Elusimicrobia bacterium]|nr:type II toxin-antitoxin system VapC family toxin [Elusimicrobiota bacterium]
MDFVLDSSAALAWALPDEHSSRSEKILARVTEKSSLWIPALWWYEVANVVVMARRRKRLSEAQGARVLELLSLFPLQVDAPPGPAAASRLSQLAQAHSLSAYDAAYLELAERRGLALATFDRDLIRAARAAGVELIEA